MAKMMRGVKGARSLFLCYKRGDKTFESDIRSNKNKGQKIRCNCNCKEKRQTNHNNAAMRVM